MATDVDSQPVTSRATSPATSLEAFPSTQPIADDMILSSQEGNQNYLQANYNTTPPPPSSMTPPPSTQPPPPRRAPIANKAEQLKRNRIATPKASMYSSPPSTAIDDTVRKRNVSNTGTYTKPFQASISQVSRSDLEAMLVNAMAEIDRLGLEVGEASTSIAHWKFQHQLLSMDSEEALKRLEVEHEMARREIEVLRLSEQHRQARAEPEIDHEYVASLRNYCEVLSEDLDTTCRRLQKAKRALKLRDDEILSLNEENGRLMKRIRENREHLSQLRSPGGIFSASTPRTFPSTPQQYRNTPKTNRSRARDESQEPFAALLLADQVLREGKERGLGQENPHNSAPSTPILSRTPIKRHQVGHGHTRAAHSLSSLPTTPVRSTYPINPDRTLLPAPQIVAQSEPRYRSTVGLNGSFSRPQSTPRRRKSRDSTISASDGEGGYADNAGRDASEEVEESQASRSASAMLRKDPRESFEIVGTPSHANTPTSEVGVKSNLLQAKIFGTVTKPGVEKRKRGSDTVSRSPQKARKLGEGVGLGIGGWDASH